MSASRSPTTPHSGDRGLAKPSCVDGCPLVGAIGQCGRLDHAFGVQGGGRGGEPARGPHSNATRGYATRPRRARAALHGCRAASASSPAHLERVARERRKCFQDAPPRERGVPASWAASVVSQLAPACAAPTMRAGVRHSRALPPTPRIPARAAWARRSACLPLPTSPPRPCGRRGAWASASQPLAGSALAHELRSCITRAAQLL